MTFVPTALSQSLPMQALRLATLAYESAAGGSKPTSARRWLMRGCMTYPSLTKVARPMVPPFPFFSGMRAMLMQGSFPRPSRSNRRYSRAQEKQYIPYLLED